LENIFFSAYPLVKRVYETGLLDIKISCCPENISGAALPPFYSFSVHIFFPSFYHPFINLPVSTILWKFG
jgi:hypothetical protein